MDLLGYRVWVAIQFLWNLYSKSYLAMILSGIKDPVATYTLNCSSEVLESYIA